MLSGKVVHGAGRGATLGFPTININPDSARKLVPGEGIYQGKIIIENKLYTAAVFIGERQTFCEHERVIEAHVLDYSGDAYGKAVTLYFQRFVREEQKFADRDLLIGQIKKDIELIKKWTNLPCIV